VAIVQLIEKPFLAAEVASIEETRGSDEEAFALRRSVVERLRALREINEFPSSPYLPPPYNDLFEQSVFEPIVLADAVAPLLSCKISQKQELLETSDVVARLQKILALLKTDQQAA
jgi:uncharacterized protein